MPSYCVTLLAIICAVTISSSVSNEAPASAQSVNVPRDEGHSHRLLRSSPVADAPSSTNAVPSSDANPDIHEERGFSIKQPYYNLIINLGNKHIRLKIFLLEKYLAFLRAQRKPNDGTFRKMFLALRDKISKPANRDHDIGQVLSKLRPDREKHSSHLRNVRNGGKTTKELLEGLHATKTDTLGNQYKYTLAMYYHTDPRR